jgi:uncharacterized protein (DUF849 family)
MTANYSHAFVDMAAPDIQPANNAEQVESIVTIACQLSSEPATPDEARHILGLKGLDKVNR